jgi:hypothetical protein
MNKRKKKRSLHNPLAFSAQPQKFLGKALIPPNSQGAFQGTPERIGLCYTRIHRATLVQESTWDIP